MEGKKMHLSSGTWINYYSEDSLGNISKDLFIIINEPNDMNDEIIIAAETFLDEININLDNLKKIQEQLENLYFPFGVQLLYREGRNGIYIYI